MKRPKQIESGGIVATKEPLGNLTLHSGTLGHVMWLRDTMKNKCIHGGSDKEDDVCELAFAYTQEPAALQGITGQRAKHAVRQFMIRSTPDEMRRAVKHAVVQLSKYTSTKAVPKKSLAVESRRNTNRPKSRASSIR